MANLLQSCFGTMACSPIICGTSCAKAAQLYACPNSAGSVTAHTSGNDLVIESSSHNGLSILSPANGRAHIMFGSPTHNLRGWISFDHTACYMAFHTPAAASGQGQEYLRLTATCLCSANIICAATCVKATTLCATGDVKIGETLRFTTNTPYICTGGAYIVVPSGIYVNGGTLYAENTIMSRNGICDDTGTPLTLFGGNNAEKCTVLCGKTFSCTCLQSPRVYASGTAGIGIAPNAT